MASRLPLSHRALAIRKDLSECKNADEVISELSPERLGSVAWFTDTWPELLRCGLIEAERGYRFRQENMALAHWLSPMVVSAPKSVVDIGCGSGSLLLLAAHFLKPQVLLGIELQAEQLDRAQRSFRAHGIDQARFVRGDIRERALLAELGEGAFELVLANPPFFPKGWGRPSKEQSTHWSTHAEHGGAAAFLHAAAALLSPRGRAFFLYDAGRLAELIAASEGSGLKPGRYLWIGDQRPGKDHPFRIWVEFVRGQAVEELVVS